MASHFLDKTWKFRPKCAAGASLNWARASQPTLMTTCTSEAIHTVQIWKRIAKKSILDVIFLYSQGAPQNMPKYVEIEI